MKGPAAALGAWSALLGLNAIVLAAWTSARLPPTLLGSAAVLAALGAGYFVVAGRRGEDEDLRTVPDLSFATVAVALGLIAVPLSAVAGIWLTLVGGGLTVLGVLGLVGERRGARGAG